MPRPRVADPDEIRQSIAGFLAQRPQHQATRPEICAHLSAQFRQMSFSSVSRYAREALLEAGFDTERRSAQGPVTIHVRLSAARRSLRDVRRGS